MSAAPREFGAGPLAQVAAVVYTVLVVELLMLATAAPGLMLLVLLDRSPSNLPLVALCAVPLGPALSAALYALHHRRADLTELRPAAAFWRGYRANVLGVLKVWVPLLVWLTILALNLTYFRAAGVPGWWAVLLVLVAVAASLWGLGALVITSLFAFRVTDVARLSLYFLAHTPGVAFGNACLLVVAVAVVVLLTEVVLALLGSLFALALLRNSRPVIAQIRQEFTA